MKSGANQISAPGSDRHHQQQSGIVDGSLSLSLWHPSALFIRLFASLHLSRLIIDLTASVPLADVLLYSIDFDV